MDEALTACLLIGVERGEGDGEVVLLHPPPKAHLSTPPAIELPPLEVRDTSLQPDPSPLRSSVRDQTHTIPSPRGHEDQRSEGSLGLVLKPLPRAVVVDT